MKMTADPSEYCEDAALYSVLSARHLVLAGKTVIMVCELYHLAVPRPGISRVWFLPSVLRTDTAASIAYHIVQKECLVKLMPSSVSIL